MKGLGYGRGYRYAHDTPEHFDPAETFLPDSLRGRRYYEPTDLGAEAALKSRVDALRRSVREAGQARHRRYIGTATRVWLNGSGVGVMIAPAMNTNSNTKRRWLREPVARHEPDPGDGEDDDRHLEYQADTEDERRHERDVLARPRRGLEHVAAEGEQEVDRVRQEQEVAEGHAADEQQEHERAEGQGGIGVRSAGAPDPTCAYNS